MTNLKKHEEQLLSDAEALGLSFDKVIFRSATPDEIREIAAFGLPSRYLHWVFGAQYKNLDIMEKSGQMHIYELVLNSMPVVANLSTKNSLHENIMVMAHVFGHADIFRNNKEYKKTDKNMVNTAADNVANIDALTKKHSKRTIDDYLTALMSVAKASMNTFHFPAKKKKSLFYVLQEMAPKEKHEEQLFEIVRQESEYFDVIFRTQYLNEGWAQFIELELLKKYFSPNQWIDFAASCSGRPGPYQIGQCLFSSIKNRYGFDKCLEVREYYDDITLVEEFMTQKLVNTLKLGVKYGENIITDVDVVINEILEEKRYQHIPPITVDCVERKHGSLCLVLEYHEREGRKLETEVKLPLYMQQINHVWKQNIELAIYDTEKKCTGQFLFDRHGVLKTLK